MGFDDNHLHNLSPKLKNWLIRAAASVVLIPLTIWLVFAEMFIFRMALFIVCMLMIIEWQSMTKRQTSRKILWQLAGIAYVFVFAASWLQLRTFGGGSWLLLWLLITVWSADVGGFVVGQLVGGRKFAPDISPGKTWSGFVGAIVASIVAGFFVSRHVMTPSCSDGLKHMTPMLIITITTLLGVLSQFSDLLESWIKRKAGVKDSGALIPGHGGILDRTDSLVLTSPALVLIVVLLLH